MHKSIKTAADVFVTYGGTENGVTSQSSTACEDSFATMMANSLLVLGPFPNDIQGPITRIHDSNERDS